MPSIVVDAGSGPARIELFSTVMTVITVAPLNSSEPCIAPITNLPVTHRGDIPAGGSLCGTSAIFFGGRTSRSRSIATRRPTCPADHRAARPNTVHMPADFDDASLVALAERRNVASVASADQDFAIYRFAGNRRFKQRGFCGAAKSPCHRVPITRWDDLNRRHPPISRDLTAVHNAKIAVDICAVLGQSWP